MKNRHEMIDARSRAFGCAVAAKLTDRPQLVQDALANIDRWLPTMSPGVARTLEEWRGILNGPLDGVIHVLTNMDERSIRLRQSTPFAGALSNAERNEILLAYENHDPTTT